ncbi:hypothetical protein C7S14_8268 [Burkholderia cepacia]|nr:hypothetical protein C7S14_8268 [Burkholderia cepacia]
MVERRRKRLGPPIRRAAEPQHVRRRLNSGAARCSGANDRTGRADSMRRPFANQEKFDGK